MMICNGNKLTFITALTHFENGKAKMVDISRKPSTDRYAHARALIRLPAQAKQALLENNKKGDPLHVAILGGIMGTKLTSTLIPLCHAIPLNSVDVDCELDGDCVIVNCHVKAHHHTGVEMEALTGATVASLIVYDMLKAASHGITIENIHLVAKTGGKRDFNSK